MPFILTVGIIVLAIISYRIKLLTLSGAIASVFVGIGIMLGTGFGGLLLLGIFFVTSSILGKIKKNQRKQANNIVEKGSTRDAWQVLANGFAATFFSILFYLFENDLFLYGFILSLAIATSDTWASELGVLSKSKPIHIRTWRRVDRGISGAVSIFGTAMSIVGSFLISILAYLFFGINFNEVILLTVFGFLGCMVDTIIGAFMQVTYTCKICNVKVESKIHCNKPALHDTGWKWMNNDQVNFLSTFGFSIFIILIWYFVLS